MCQNCNVIKDEKHFLLNFHLYNSCRAEFLNKLKSFVVLDSADSDKLFVDLMSSLNGDIEIAGHLCDYVNHCFDERREYISHHDHFSSEPVFTRVGRLSGPPCKLNL